MTCEEYRVLLDQLLDGTISPEDEKKLLLHESECPECAELHTSLSDIQADLSGLADDVPPLPEDFHAQWTAKLSETPSEGRKPRPLKIRFSPGAVRALAACAVVVLVVGITLLSGRLNAVNVSPAFNIAAPSLLEEAPLPQSTAMMALSQANAPAEPDVEAEMAVEAAEAEYDAAAGEMSFAESAVMQNDTGSMKTAGGASDASPAEGFHDTLAAIVDLGKSLNGSVSVSSITENEGLRSALLEIRIPKDHTDAFLAALNDLNCITECIPVEEDAGGEYQTFSMTVSEGET